VPGTLSTAMWPAAVTTALVPVFTMYQASQAVSKMLLTGPPELRARANASGGLANCGACMPTAIDLAGNLVFGFTGDSMIGGLGAFGDRDGADTGGAWWWPRVNAGNAEEFESMLPLLYLYRREQADSGGPGRFRGGNGVGSA
jgi:N-methylhydantoinase B